MDKKQLFDLAASLDNEKDMLLIFDALDYINELELSVKALKSSKSRSKKLLESNGFIVKKKL